MDIASIIGMLLSLEPHLNVKKVRTSIKALIEIVQGISSYQLIRHIYKGIVVAPEEYTLMG